MKRLRALAVVVALLVLLRTIWMSVAPAHTSSAVSRRAVSSMTVTELPASPAARSMLQPPTPSTPLASPTTTPVPKQSPTVLPLRQRFRVQSGDQVVQIKPGIIHVSRATDDPLKINILLFDLTMPQFNIKTALGQGWLIGRYRTSHMVQENNALAGVNGDLFSEDGIPQGLTMIDSQVVTAPKHRATFAWNQNHEPFIGYFTNDWTWDAQVTASDGASMAVPQLNLQCDIGLVCMYNRFVHTVPQRAGDVKVVLDKRNRVTDIIQASRVRVLTDTTVLQGSGDGARWLTQHVNIGDRLGIAIQTTPNLSDYTQAISGGPVLLREGTFIEDCMCVLHDCRHVLPKDQGLLCEDFTTDWKKRHYRFVRMPRTGIGYDQQKQTLIVAVVDGYQRGYSRGSTQAEFAALMREFGAYTAMELDGGGSATMVLKNKVVNKPPDVAGERYVADALLFFWNEQQHITEK